MAASRSIKEGHPMHPLLPPILGATLVPILALTLAAAGGQEENAKPAYGTSPARSADDAVLADLLAAHNKVRAEEKKPPLLLEPHLTEAALAHARDMAEHSKLSHEGSDGSEPKTRIKRVGYHYKDIGENVAEGQVTVGDVMRSWIDSPPHRANILGDFTQMGGAVATASDGRKYWCVDFGRPMPQVDPRKSPVELIAALNRARSQAKKRPIRLDSQLNRVAARFAQLAADRKKLELKDSEGQTPYDVLEVQGYSARRFAMTMSSGEGEPAQVVAGWIKEARDREILMSGFERAGVGVATDSDGAPYWLLLLAQGVER